MLADGKYSPRIGELLKSKAEEGLVVNLMQQLQHLLQLLIMAFALLQTTLAIILEQLQDLLWLQSQVQFQRTLAGIAPHLLSLSALTTLVHCLIS